MGEKMCKKSFWVKSLVEMFIGEKYVQETFLGEESLNEKYIRVKKKLDTAPGKVPIIFQDLDSPTVVFVGSFACCRTR